MHLGYNALEPAVIFYIIWPDFTCLPNEQKMCEYGFPGCARKLFPPLVTNS